MNGPKNYKAYGLKIRSEISLDEFVSCGAGESDAEVSIEFGPDPGWISGVRGDQNRYRIRRDEARFWFKQVGGFVVKDGCRVIVVPEEDCDESGLRLYVEGMMMATILHQRGLSVLHASVVDIHGSAVAFLGSVGAGKSSIAAALYSRGHRVVTDDNAAIQLATGIPMVVPAYPSVKLFPEIASSLGFRNGTLSVLHASLPKMAGMVATGFVQTPLPLRRVYFLGGNIRAKSCQCHLCRLHWNWFGTRCPLAGHIPGMPNSSSSVEILRHKYQPSLCRLLPIFRPCQPLPKKWKTTFGT